MCTGDEATVFAGAWMNTPSCIMAVFSAVIACSPIATLPRCFCTSPGCSVQACASGSTVTPAGSESMDDSDGEKVPLSSTSVGQSALIMNGVRSATVVAEAPPPTVNGTSAIDDSEV